MPDDLTQLGDTGLFVQPVGVDRELHVEAVAHADGAAQLLGPCGDVLVDFQPAAAGSQSVLDHPGARRRCAHEQQKVQRYALEGRVRRLHQRRRV